MRNDVKFSSFLFSKFSTQMLRPLYKPESSRRSPNPLNTKCTHFIKRRYYHGPNRVLLKVIVRVQWFRVYQLETRPEDYCSGMESDPRSGSETGSEAGISARQSTAYFDLYSHLSTRTTHRAVVTCIFQQSGFNYCSIPYCSSGKWRAWPETPFVV